MKNYSLPPTFYRLGISQSILLGFLLLLAISLIVTGFHYSGLNQFYKHFSRFQTTSASTNMMLRIDKDVSELQRQILAFSNTEKVATITQLKNFHQTLLDHIEQLIAIEDPGHRNRAQKLAQMKIAVEGLTEKIDSLPVERHYRESVINQELADLYNKTEMTVDDIFTLLKQSNSNQLLTEIWVAEHHLDQAQFFTNRYFSKHESRIKQDVISSLLKTETTLKALLPLTGNPAIKEKIHSILDLLVNIRIVFSKAVQADRNYLFLINVVLAGETAEITNVSQDLRRDYLDQQQQLVQTTDNQLNLIRQIIIISSVIGTLLALVIVILIIHSIRKPLHSIADTFSRLATGENLQNIPGTERSDEIGKLANAANVFRETNVRTQALLTQTKEFTEQLKQREIELQLVAQKAESANISKSQFLANMSHELRTPMNAVLGMLSLLQKTELTSKQTDYLVKSEGAAKSLLSLLNDILDLSKAEAGKMELDPVAFNLDILLRDLAVILSTNLNNKAIELVFDIEPSVPRFLVGDALRLQQILINLGGNAIKFTERGSVVIGISVSDISIDSVKLTIDVKDSGIGIAPENRQKIFNGFTQAEASTTRRFGGTGLGLAISQRLVALMGGRLELESQLGTGSRFFFEINLPLATQEQIVHLQSPNNNTQHQTYQRLTSLKILLAEDNLTNQQIATELLEAEGARVQVANNGQEVIDFLQSNLSRQGNAGVDLILMDLQMPIMDGISATTIIRQQLHLTQLPIIAMTANAMKSDRDACLDAGMNEHLGKPFDLEHVVSVLRQFANLPASSVDNAVHKDTLAEEIKSEIDLKGALARMGGNHNLYARMLPKFSENLRNLPDLLKGLLDKGDIPSIARELHSLKGVAATMGAVQLTQEVTRIEKILKNSSDHPDAHKMVTLICSLITTTIANLDALAKEIGSRSAN